MLFRRVVLLMDAGSNYVVCAWASLPSHVLTKDRTQTTPTVGKLTETHPRQLIPHLHIDGLRRVACMRGPGREFLSIDSTKGAIECPRPQAKADSSSDETPVDLGSRGGLVSRISSGRRGNGSASSSPPRGALVAELPTVAEVLRTAKVFLQPTHAVERQVRMSLICLGFVWEVVLDHTPLHCPYDTTHLSRLGHWVHEAGSAEWDFLRM